MESRHKLQQDTGTAFPVLDFDKALEKLKQHPELLMDPPKGTYKKKRKDYGLMPFPRLTAPC